MNEIVDINFSSFELSDDIVYNIFDTENNLSIKVITSVS